MRKPYLVQRANFKNLKTENGSIDDTLYFDYMGSAEFEFGALPKSLKRITSKIDSVIITENNDCESSVDGGHLRIISIVEPTEEYLKAIDDIASGDHELKESAHMGKMVSGKGFRGESIKPGDWCHTEAWWDIENDVFMTFGDDNAEKIISALVVTRDRKKASGETGWF